MTLAPVHDTPTELLPARSDTDSWVTVVREITLLSQQIAGTDFVPRGIRNSIPATAAAMLYGREIGLPPMTALSQIHVVEGRPGLSAEGMRALVLAAGHEIVFEESTSAVCRVRGRRHRSQEWTTVEWTIDDARRAGLLRRGSAWESYPADMLVARASTVLCRRVFPDVIHGFRSIEELDDMAAPPAAGTPSGRTPAASRAGTGTKVSRAKRPEIPAAPTVGPVEAPHSSPGPTSAPAYREPSLPSGPGMGEEAVEGDRQSDDPPAPPPQDDQTDQTEEEAPKPPKARRSRRSKPPETPAPGPTRSDSGAGPEEPPAADPPAETGPPNGEAPVNPVTLKIVFGQLRRLGISDDEVGREQRLEILAQIAGRPLTSANDLSQPEAVAISAALSTARDRATLDELLAFAALADIAEPVVEDLLENTEAKPPDGGDQ